MKNKETIKKILIVLVIAIVALILYSVLAPTSNTNSPASSSLSSSRGTSASGRVQETSVALANAEILKILGSIQNIELRDDIFTSPVFKSLADTRFTVPKPAKIGRTNPFLPIGFDRMTTTEQLNTSNTAVQNTDITNSGTEPSSSFFDFNDLEKSENKNTPQV